MIFNFIISLFLIFNPDSRLEKKIDKYLETKLIGYENYEYKIKSIPKFNSDSDEIFINNNKELKIRGKNCYIPVTVKKNGRKLNSIISLEIKLYDEVLIARRKLSKGENLSRSDFYVVVKDLTQYKCETLSERTPLEFFRAKRTINPETVLTIDQIEGIPVVKSGDKIIANVIKGNVHITLEAEAKQEGIVGDEIRIFANKKYYRAEIVDPKNVKIIEN